MYKPLSDFALVKRSWNVCKNGQYLHYRKIQMQLPKCALIHQLEVEAFMNPLGELKYYKYYDLVNMRGNP